MKVKNYIFQGLSLLMLLCVFTTQVSALSIQEKCTESSTEDTENDQPVFRQITHETVVPTYDFSFGEINTFFINPTFTSLFSDAISESNPSFSSPVRSHLIKILEHHIDSNAP